MDFPSAVVTSVNAAVICLDAKCRFIHVLRERFNSGVKYKGRILKWDTIIEQKATELGRLLVNRMRMVDFAEPEAALVKRDERALRSRILSLSQLEAKQLEISKSTLHSLRERAKRNTPVRVYATIAERLGGL